MDRAEHLQWCKTRALEYVTAGDLSSAVASMVSDMGTREDCGVNPILIQLGMLHVMNSNPPEVRRWIEGFN